MLTGVGLLLAAGVSTAEVTMEGAWIRAMPPTATMLAGYGTLVNHGNEPRYVVAAVSPRFGHVSIHRTVMKDGVARMEATPRLEIPAAGRTALEPGGLHLMLMRPGKPLARGDRVWICLELDDGSWVELYFEVRDGPVS